MNPPAFQFYADDFLAGTMDMSQAEVGAYIRLLCCQWSTGSVPQDPVRQKRIAGGQVSDAVLSKFQNSEDGKLTNPKMEKVRAAKNEFAASQSAKGKAGAEARWRHKSNDGPGYAPAIAPAMPRPSLGQWPENGSPVSSLQSPSPVQKRKEGGVGENHFAESLSVVAAEEPQRASKKTQVSDEEWLKELAGNPTYAGIDVIREHGKMTAWCETNRKQASRRRFINWLNRAEKPMKGGFAANGNTADKRSLGTNQEQYAATWRQDCADAAKANISREDCDL